jgi:ABC-type uncharacterized transport system substrate-binding protein
MPIVMRVILAFMLLALGAGGAAAHPHMFVQAKGELVFGAKGEITGVRNVWQFDKAFTREATADLDANHDGRISDAELKPLAKINMEALKDYEYFTFLKRDGVKAAFDAPREYWLQLSGGLLTLFFTVPLKTPMAAKGSTTVEIYDPEYFVAITFVKNTPFKLDAPPSGCGFRFQPPGVLDSAIQTKLLNIPADQRELPPEMQDYTTLMANRFIVTCP